MADFDDLLSSSRTTSNAPVFDNPFQDVFDGVAGRPRSPDPWSSGGGWGDPDPLPITNQHPVQATTSPPVSPGGFKSFDQPFSYRDPEPEYPVFATPAQHKPQDASKDEPPLPVPQTSIDPLGSDLQQEEEVPVKRNPLGPLPPAPKLPNLPPIHPPPSSGPPATKSPTTPVAETPTVPVVIEPSRPSDVTVSSPTVPPAQEPIQTPKAAVPSPLDGSSSLTPTSTRIVPPIPPSPLTPHPPTPTSSSDLSIHDRSPSGSASIDSRSLATGDSTTNIKYDRIVSPLETPPAALPKRSSLEQGFSNLALGGEAPGWGSTSSSTQGFPGFVASDDHSGGFDDGAGDGSITERQTPISPSHSVDTVKDDNDEEDNKPLVPPPVFIITVGDPQKVGDPISAHIVYTVQTKTTSPAFAKASFSVLRRYSDFLWLYETLSANNPGVIVPPVPEKNPFTISRFESEFVEQRRLALNKCIQKIANHPVLSNDEDFRFFLESDSFALDIKHRRGDNTGGLLATFGSLAAPKFYEIDEWFDSKRAYLDALESQLKGLVKAIEMVSKQRAEFAMSISEFAEAVSALSMSDLSKQLTQALSVLADVERLYKDIQDSQAKDDMVTIMGTADEYGRLINSVRLAFNSRVKLYFNWQSADSECRRIKSAHEKARRQGRSTGSMAEIAEFSRRTKAERRAQEAKREFDTVTKLIKMELARFESERVEDFKASLEQFLEGMIRKQKALILAWENYQGVLLKKASTNPTDGEVEGPPTAAEAEDI
ncbi:Vacuolar protein sorting-associated protein 5 [Tulasnella sp. 403]|nr:Vacuolar protein sorting-associated protein 5 [Tulasnella sp. 403]